MTNVMIERALHQQLKTMPTERQQEVLDFARNLSALPLRGIPGQVLLKFAGTIPATDLKKMTRSIQSECEKIDNHEW